jgi:hypothetical protein
VEQHRREGHDRSVVAGRTLERRLRGSRVDRHLREALAGAGDERRSVFATLGNDAVARALARDGRFCRDTPLGALLHPQRPSFRELRTQTGLHIVFEAPDRISAHLDRRPPAAARRPDGRCRYTRRRTAHHIWRDVLLLLVHLPSAASPDPHRPPALVGTAPAGTPSRRRAGRDLRQRSDRPGPPSRSDGGRGPPPRPGRDRLAGLPTLLRTSPGDGAAADEDHANAGGAPPARHERKG